MYLTYVTAARLTNNNAPPIIAPITAPIFTYDPPEPERACVAVWRAATGVDAPPPVAGSYLYACISALVLVSVVELICRAVLVSKDIERVSVKNVGTTVPSMLHKDDTSILLVET